MADLPTPPSTAPRVALRPVESGLVSVIIPTYNRARLVRGAVESVLAQDYRQLEVLVVDDGSTDETRQLIEGMDPRVRYIPQANAGVAAARNRAIAAARGEFLAFLDSDDEWLPWKLAAEVALLRAHPDATLVWSDMSAIDPTGKTLADRYLRTYYMTYLTVRLEDWMSPVGTLAQLGAPVPPEAASALVLKGPLFPALFLGNLVHTSTVLLRHTLIERVGAFDESYAKTDDYELWLRGSVMGDYLLLDVPTIRYRVGGEDQLSNPRTLRVIAHQNLRIVRLWTPAAEATARLAPGVLAGRVAHVLAWAGEEELMAGAWPTAGYFLRSLRHRPRQFRTAVLLILGVLPPPMVRALLAIHRGLRSLR
jgi:glycosyltransferase involved in cell wall biosynthesis